jgi:hypothetical protein
MIASEPVDRTLPPTSSVVLPPVPKPRYRANDDARVQLKRMEGGLDEANLRLEKSAKTYSGVRRTYGAK